MREYLRRGRRPGQRYIASKFVRGRFPERIIGSPTVFGATMYGDLRDVITQRVHFFGIWEPNLTRWMLDRLQPGDVMVDVGAHIGYFSLLAAHAVGETGGVVSVEPSPNRNAMLRRNHEANCPSIARAAQVAIANEHGFLDLFRGHDPASATTVATTGRGVEARVPVQPLSEVLTDDEIARMRILKIDIEGREYEAAASLAGLLDRVRDDFEAIIEITPAQNHVLGHTPRDLLNLLTPHGYHPWHLPNDYGLDSYVDWVRDGSYCTPVPMPLDDPWWDSPAGEQRDVIFTRSSSE